MNLPNKLTMLRILMIPVFLVFMLIKAIPGNYLIALLIFAAASLTDLLDGYIARRDNLVTSFGKLMDPLADKLLVMSAMICFVSMGLAGPVAVIIILGREFLVTSVRLVAASSGKVIAADIWGKIKTVAQMIWICFILLFLYLGSNIVLTTTPRQILSYIALALEWLVVILTLYSGFHYLWNNRSLFADR